MLNKLLLSRCTLIHTKASCEVSIEEINDIREEIEQIVESVEYLHLVRDRKLQLPLDAKSMTTR